MSENSQTTFDVAIIGGGINGCGIARDAQGRGLKTLLLEKHDLANATSSSSTKLIHGGLRYLEQYEFKLVREALNERELLMKQAPHIIWPLKFVLPHSPEQRPAWMVRIGLFLYDFLGKRDVLPGSKSMDLTRELEGKPLQNWIKKGFSYSDLWAQDTRISILSAMEAKAKGATVLTRTEVTSAIRSEDKQSWVVTTLNTKGETNEFRAKALFNASGPWAGDVDARVLGANKPGVIRMVKGSHIVVNKLFEGDQAYILQNDDERVIFAIPYEHNYTLIGTTDVDYEGDPKQASCSDEEKSYLCRAVNRYFNTQVTPEHIVWTYSGVRPLLETDGEDAQQLSRGYTFGVVAAEESAGAEAGQKIAPRISVYGGKITAFRELADDAMSKLGQHMDVGTAWTKSGTLPGGNFEQVWGTLNFDEALTSFQKQFSFLPDALARRYMRNYGTLAVDFLKDAQSLADMGQHLGDDIYEKELAYLAAFEFAQTGEDVYWRRSRLGLHLKPETMVAIDNWMETHAA
ncbi:MAG: glycerol-3-phosphate dehydrogenase [Alphaproteobacteria bacterium]